MKTRSTLIFTSIMAYFKKVSALIISARTPSTMPTIDAHTRAIAGDE